MPEGALMPTSNRRLAYFDPAHGVFVVLDGTTVCVPISKLNQARSDRVECLLFLLPLSGGMMVAAGVHCICIIHHVVNGAQSVNIGLAARPRTVCRCTYSGLHRQ